MPDDRRVKCQVCHKRREEVGDISWRGKCSDCGKRILHQACDDQHYHRGPYFTRWRRGMAACVGGVLVDDVLREA